MEAIWGIKLKLCRNVYNVSLCKNGVFIAIAHVPSLLWQFSFHWLIMGKWKLAVIAISLQIFWQKNYRSIPWKVLYQTYHFCPNLLIWFVAMATERLNLWKNIKKIISSDAIRGIKLKLCWNIHNVFITLASTERAFFITDAHVLLLL